MRNMRWYNGFASHFASSAVLLLLGAGLAGCVAVVEDSAESPELLSSGDSPALGQTDDASLVEESDDSEETQGVLESPIAALIDSQSGALAADEAEIIYAEAFARCMRNEGLEYTTYVPTKGDVSKPDKSGPDEFTLEWAETYGFGVSTLAFDQMDLPQELIGHPGTQIEVDDQDPNLLRYESLSDSDKQVYDEVAYGTEDFPGCIGVATGEAYGNQDAIRQAYDLIHEDLASLTDSAMSDARVVEFENRVGECVQNQGFDFLNVELAISSLHEQMEDTVYAQTGPPERHDHGSEANPENFDANLSSTQLESLKSLQQYEVDLATAVYKCGGISEFSEVLDTVLIELELEYLRENEGRIIAVFESDGGG